MANSNTFVIVGGGLGGAKAAEALREKDFDGRIVLCAEEQHLPYERPPLSKEFLAGKKSLSDFTVHDSAWYRKNDIDLRVGTAVSAVDPTAHTAVQARQPQHRSPPVRVHGGCRSRGPMPPESITCGRSTMRRR